jgi:hypothetical protein
MVGKTRAAIEASDIIRNSANLPNDPFVLKINDRFA